MTGNYPDGMTGRDWAHVNGEEEEDATEGDSGTLDPSEDDTSPHRGNYND